MTRKNTPARTVVSLAALTLIATAGVLFAGPLNPPAGPVASTYKTLSEVEPRIAINATNTPGDVDSLFMISQPGSYYLTGNIQGVAGKHGIEIGATGVALDLNGFDLVGVAGSLDGVIVTLGAAKNIAVVNGSVRNWGDRGVDLASATPTNCRVEGVRASSNIGNGISTSLGSTVFNCSAFLNTGTGISTGSGSTTVNCSAFQNTGTGISTSFGCLVTNCSASNNAGIGISTGLGCTVTNCSAEGNATFGISVGTGCTVTNSSAASNAGSGIDTGVGCAVTNCSASNNTINGISTSPGCTIAACSAQGNAGSGISAFTGCTVADCTARANTLDGIVCTSACLIRGNTSVNNGLGDGAGIHATNIDNRIEGNTCTGADRGIDVDLAGNFIIRNSCSGNTINWVIVANNVCGPILDRTAPASAAISGNSAPSSLGTTDPNANFSY